MKIETINKGVELQRKIATTQADMANITAPHSISDDGRPTLKGVLIEGVSRMYCVSAETRAELSSKTLAHVQSIIIPILEQRLKDLEKELADLKDE